LKPPLLTNDKVALLDREAVVNYEEIIPAGDNQAKQIQKVKDMLFRWQSELEHVFLFYSAMGASTVEAVAYMELPSFLQLVKDCRIPCRQVPLIDFEEIFKTAAAQQLVPLLYLQEFLGSLVRIALRLHADKAAPEECLRRLLVSCVKPNAMKVVPGSFRERLFDTEVTAAWTEREAKLKELFGMYARRDMPHIVCGACNHEEVSGKVKVDLTVADVIQMLKDMELCSDKADGTVALSERDQLTSREAYKALVVPDVDDPASDSIVFPASSPSPYPPSPVEDDLNTEGLPTFVAAEGDSRPNSAAPSVHPSDSVSRRPSMVPSAGGDKTLEARRGSRASNRQGRRASQLVEACEQSRVAAQEPLEGLSEDRGGVVEGSLYLLSTPVSFMEALEGLLRVLYLMRVKDTNAVLAPLVAEMLDKCINILEKDLPAFNEAQAKSAHRVKRNREIAAGGLTDEQQALVLELHYLVDQLGDGNGCVDRYELESAIGDKRGKLFSKLDVDKSGGVDPEEFLSYFEQMSINRGRKAAEGLLSFVSKGIQKIKDDSKERERVQAEIAAAQAAAAEDGSGEFEGNSVEGSGNSEEES